MNDFKLYLWIFIISILSVSFHEIGHLFAAKITKIAIKTFSLGYGPKLVSFNKNEIEYRLSLLPGGYIIPQKNGKDFFQISFLKRVFLHSGGIAANFFVFIISLCILHLFDLSYSPKITILRGLNSRVHIIAVSPDFKQFIHGNDVNFAGLAVIMNAFLLMMNLLPFYSFDGGKIIFAFLDKYYPKGLRAYLCFSLIGSILLGACVIYGVVYELFIKM
jgi:membrane-associated protease RseP (regulator of RpoE activity)